MATDSAYLGSPDNPRTAAIVGYITVIGWLIAYFMLYRSNKNDFAAFHLRQTLLLHLLSFVFDVLCLFALWRWIPYSIVVVLAVLLFILWLIGVMGAINGSRKPVPVVGLLAQRMFSGI